MLEWLGDLSNGAATFVGSFSGASLGLVAIVIGAMLNARFNDRPRRAARRQFVDSTHWGQHSVTLTLRTVRTTKARGVLGKRPAG